MNQGGGGNIPPWLIPAMNSLAGMNFSGGGMGNQQPQMQAPSSGLLAVGPGGPMPVQNAFEAAQMKARADADWNARIAGGTVGPNWGNPDFLSGVGKWPAPRPEAYGMPRQQSGWTM
jgi:hypothetical protein